MLSLYYVYRSHEFADKIHVLILNTYAHSSVTRNYAKTLVLGLKFVGLDIFTSSPTPIPSIHYDVIHGYSFK